MGLGIGYSNGGIGNFVRLALPGWLYYSVCRGRARLDGQRVTRQGVSDARGVRSSLLRVLVDPYPVLERACKEVPVFYYPEMGFWIVTRMKDLVTAVNGETRCAVASLRGRRGAERRVRRLVGRRAATAVLTRPCWGRSRGERGRTVFRGRRRRCGWRCVDRDPAPRPWLTVGHEITGCPGGAV